MTVHVIGNVCVDTTFLVERFPAPGETLAALSCHVGIGGKGVNQAVAAARAGANVSFHAAVGRDEAAARIRRVLAAERMGLHLADRDRPTDSSMLLVRPDGENLIVSDVGCAHAFNPLDGGGFAGNAGKGDVVVFQGNLRVETTVACLRAAAKASAYVVLNPSPVRASDAFDWSCVDLAIANAREIEILTGETNPEAGAAALRARGAVRVVVSLGRRGALLLDADGVRGIAAPEVVALDTSGAGDVLCGVAVGLIAQGASCEVALAHATAAAALSVTRRGALESCPSAAEIRHLAAATIERRPL